MLEEGYWRSKEEQLIKNELQQALLFYKNTKAKHLPKMITAYVRDLHNELSALAEADVSFGDEATAANDDIDCNELEDTTVLQEGSPQDADFVAELEAELDFEDSYDGYSPGGDHGAAHEIESPASCNVVGTVDALCSPKLHGNLLHLCPTMKVQISTLTSQSEHDLCTLQVEGAELYTVFKPRSPAKFASHTFYRSHTTKHVSVAVSPDLQLPKHMVGSEFLVQIVPGVGEGALRVLWVDVLRRKSKSFIGQDAKTRNECLKELYSENSLLLPSAGSQITSSVIPTASSAAQLKGEAGLHAEGILFFTNCPGTMEIACFGCRA
mmetsp:Transcript_10292/g.24183  ORF Transcript_10292/g.24183 Transcript_10292/m.24183 type:complete len:324 (-) Transcript_10292:2066-3037(-)